MSDMQQGQQFVGSLLLVKGHNAERSSEKQAGGF